jgi:hypothetical protein
MCNNACHCCSVVQFLQDTLLTAELQDGDNLAAAINLLTSTSGSGQGQGQGSRGGASTHRHRSLLLSDTTSHFSPQLHHPADVTPSWMYDDSMAMANDHAVAWWPAGHSSSHTDGYTGGHAGGHTSWMRSLLQSQPAASGCAMPGGDNTTAVVWAPNQTVCACTSMKLSLHSAPACSLLDVSIG